MTAAHRQAVAVATKDSVPGDPGPESAPQPGLLLRVEKGEPDAVELAALAAVLQRRVAAVAVAEEAPRRSARWRRPERVAGFAGARTWRN